MRIDNGHTCNTCCFFFQMEGDSDYGYCQYDTTYKTVRCNDKACMQYTNDDEENK